MKFRTIAILLVLAYFVGLVRDINEPWIGRHDWNGAFFSQLARNLLRYPFSMHHGMPVVAMGALPPPPGEFCFYPRHPPGLVWLVGLFFGTAGESEAVARIPFIAVSVLCIIMLISIVRRTYGSEVALITGAIYALMPMSVYFGRMVNHEPICLCMMLLGLHCWLSLRESATKTRRRLLHCTLAFSLFIGIWTDWPGLLFAAILFLHSFIEWRRKNVPPELCLNVLIATAASVVLLIPYLTYYGFDGHWSAFVDMFRARTAIFKGAPWWAAFGWIPSNLTWPVILLCVTGIAWKTAAWSRERGSGTPLNRTPRLAKAVHIGDQAASRALHTITLTALFWVIVFWRQFQIHEYWMFFCGPVAAIYSGIAIQKCAALVFGPGSRRTAVEVVFTGVVGIWCLVWQNTKFNHVDFILDGVNSFKQLAAQTRPDQRVVLTWDPIFTEVQGSFEFRNIIAPQFAYYLDRAFDVETNPEMVQKRIAAHEFVIYR